MKTILKLAVSAAVLVAASASAHAAGDAEKGERVFRKCATCHAVGEGARNKVGPVLNILIGRAAGTGEGYRYSKINTQAGEAGLVWTAENIAAYLPEPQKFLSDFIKEAGGKPSGRTKMSYRLRKEEEVADVIAYLATFSPEAAAEGETAEGEAATQ